MYSWTQSSLGSAQTCRPLLVLKLWRRKEGLYTGECSGGDPGPSGTPLLLPWTPQGLSTCSYRVPFTLGFTDLPGSPVGVPSESQHRCLANERGGQFPAATPLLSSLCPGADPPGPSAGPKPGEKTRCAPPWCPEEVPQARPPGSFPRAGRKAGPYMTPGWEHWLLVS